MQRPVQDDDPIVASGKREACFAIGLWVIATAWSIGYSALFGYERSLDDLRFVLGFPDWIFWGIVLPWVLCFAVSSWFALAFLRAEPLEEAADTAGAADAADADGSTSAEEID